MLTTDICSKAQLKRLMLWVGDHMSLQVAFLPRTSTDNLTNCITKPQFKGPATTEVPELYHTAALLQTAPAEPRSTILTQKHLCNILGLSFLLWEIFLVVFFSTFIPSWKQLQCTASSRLQLIFVPILDMNNLLFYELCSAQITLSYPNSPCSQADNLSFL